MDNTEQAFDQVAEKAVKDFGANMGVNVEAGETAPSRSASNTQESGGVHEQKEHTSEVLTNQQAQALAELEKIGKFTYKGQQMTVADLEKAMLRQQDYTKKTQGLSEERKAFEREQKFHENLYYDLARVKANPNLANDFLRLYPEKFHKHLEELFSEGEVEDKGQEARSQAQTPDVQLLSRINKLETHFHEQEVSKNRQEIDKTVDDLSKKYPDANPELALSRAYEAYNAGTSLTKEVWENIFKKCDQDGKEWVKSRYSQMVKKQTAVNTKSRDVEGGGGTVDRAPHKFNSIDDVTKHAISQLRGE